MSNIDRILGGDKDALIEEITNIIAWARGLSKEEWRNITNDTCGGLHGVVSRIVNDQVTEVSGEADRNKIFDICIMVQKITGEEVQECREIARDQREYFSPLRPATTKRQNDLGEYNEKVLDALLKLKEIIESGADLGS